MFVSTIVVSFPYSLLFWGFAKKERITFVACLDILALFEPSITPFYLAGVLIRSSQRHPLLPPSSFYSIFVFGLAFPFPFFFSFFFGLGLVRFVSGILLRTILTRTCWPGFGQIEERKR